MIRRPTVFVVGAGASCELGFPSGPALLENIGRALDIRFDGFTQKSGAHEIMAAYKRHHHQNNPDTDLNDYLHAGWRLREASKIARSIDNAMDQNGDNPKVTLAGKFAIASEILKAEHNSIIYQGDGFTPKNPVDKAKNTWLHYFAQIITTEIQPRKLESIFEDLSIITFNYDRSIEHYLPFALISAYGIPLQVAQQLVKGLRIFHPYGQVGPLPWLTEDSSTGAIDFGEDPQTRLEAIASGLQTFTESRRVDEELNTLRSVMSAAEQIVFLGFGFHRPNLEIIKPVSGIRATKIMGTAFNEPNPARGVAMELLNNLFDEPKNNPYSFIDLTSIECTGFLRDNFSVITQ